MQDTDLENRVVIENQKLNNPPKTQDAKLWVLFVFGPSAGLALSEASFLGGILSFCMSRSATKNLKQKQEQFSQPLASSKEVIL